MVEILTKQPTALESFLNNELDTLETERQGMLTEKGYAEFLKLESGETQVTFQPVIPRLVEGSFGDRRAFRVTVHGTEYDWAVNPRSPMYRQLLVLLKKAPVTVKIIRVGEGKSTRYDLKT